MKNTLFVSCFALLAVSALGQTLPAAKEVAPYKPAKAEKPVPTQAQMDRHEIRLAEQEGVEVRIKDIGHFRGVRSNVVYGFGLITGLEGTGDTKKSPVTQTLLSNLYSSSGLKFDASQMDSKNVALVQVSCVLPAFAKPGTQLDVMVSSMGDAKSLQGGTLMFTPLYPMGSNEKAYVTASGPISIGGFNASSGGSSSQRNHVNVGRIPGGGNVEASVATHFVFSGRKLYLDLDQEDMTTAHRAAIRIAEQLPSSSPVATDGSTVELTIPDGMDPVAIISQIESLRLNADVDAKIVINERTGTIVVGGNVSIAPCAVAQGSLEVKVEREEKVVQPNGNILPGDGVKTAKEVNTKVDATQETAKVALITPKTTVADLARLLQGLKLKPTDIISILQALRQQGALKARIVLQ